MGHARIFLVTFLMLACASCSSAPANVAGTYTVNLTNDQNGCMFMNWTQGSTTSAVPLEITQNGSSVTGSIGGAGGLYLDALFGSHVFVGNVSGNHIDMVLHGTTAAMDMSCRETLDADASVDLSGDALQLGVITITIATNHDSTCPIYTQTCSSLVLFNGTRPPSAH